MVVNKECQYELWCKFFTLSASLRMYYIPQYSFIDERLQRGHGFKKCAKLPALSLSLSLSLSVYVCVCACVCVYISVTNLHEVFNSCSIIKTVPGHWGPCK